jgi:hypothetical protein
MNEANLAIARKVVLYTGLLVATLLFIYPHWRISVEPAGRFLDQDVGRFFIASAPAPVTHSLFVVQVRINYARQITEVAIALLFTFGLMRVLRLKKPVGDTTT